MKTYRWTIFLGACVVVLFAHAYYVWRFTQGYYMVGFGDGLSQMLTFKQYILQQYETWQITYDDAFGFGGGIFAQLNYYYMTNLFMIPWYIFFTIWPFETTIHTWLLLLIPMSMVKQLAIFFVSYYLLTYFTKMKWATFVGAAVYSISPFFFKNQTMVDILADIAFWLPFVLIGVERVMHHRATTWFVISTTLLLISNFYIAYIIAILTIVYILLRWCMREKNERNIITQLIRYIAGSGLAFGLSSFVFMPATFAFLDTQRPPYTQEIPLIDGFKNLFSTSSDSLWLPIFVIVFLCLPLYRVRAFRFFALISIIGTVCYFSPLIGSFFNGFSAPNTRWTPMITLGYAGLVTIVIAHLSIIRKKHWWIALTIAGMMAIIVSVWTHTWTAPLIWLALLWLIIGSLLCKRHYAVGMTILCFLIVYANIFQTTLFPKTQYANSTYIQSNKFMSEEIDQMMNYVQTTAVDPQVKVDWSNVFRENTPLLYDMNGLSAYSSIISGELMYMYMRDLQIDTGRESVSRYRTLGDRTNLLALFHTQYYIRDQQYENVPYGYSPVKTGTHFTIYENKRILPAFRVVDKLYHEDGFSDQAMLTREHAMLTGAITSIGLEEVPIAKPLKPQRITFENGTKMGDQLTVPKRKFPGKLHIQLPRNDAKTLYVQFSLTPVESTRAFKVKVNGYETARRAPNNRYATGYQQMTIAVRATDTVTIELPKGQYTLNHLQIYGENYKTLNRAVKQAVAAPIHWDNAKASGTVYSQKGNMLVTPIPFENGWHAKINGERVHIQHVNYGFIGLPLKKGKNVIELHYKPPTWNITIPLSILSLIIFIMWQWRQRKKLPS